MLYVQMYVEIGDLNLYALDYPVCTADSATARGLAKRGRSQRTWLMNNQLAALASLNGGKESDAIKAIRKQLQLAPTGSYEPCADDYMVTYLNQASVKAALHVKSDIVWADCASVTTLR